MRSGAAGATKLVAKEFATRVCPPLPPSRVRNKRPALCLPGAGRTLFIVLWTPSAAGSDERLVADVSFFLTSRERLVRIFADYRIRRKLPYRAHGR